MTTNASPAPHDPGSSPGQALSRSGSLDELYRLLTPMNVGPGWNKPAPSLWNEPRKTFVPAHWRYDQAKAALDAAGRLINTELAERRNLILVNPAEGNTYGTTRTLAAGWVRWTPAITLQILGAAADPGGPDDARIFASMRSLRDRTDPAHLEVRPDRVRLEKAPAAAPFSQMVAKFGPQAVPLEQLAVLNNLEVDQAVPAGKLIKLVEPGRPRP